MQGHLMDINAMRMKNVLFERAHPEQVITGRCSWCWLGYLITTHKAPCAACGRPVYVIEPAQAVDADIAAAQATERS